MRPPHLVDLALLAEPEAERRHFDAKNFRSARLAWYLFVALSTGALVAASATGLLPRALAALANLVALGLVALWRRRLYLHPDFALILGVALAVESFFFIVLSAPTALGVAYGCVVVPFLLLSVRLRFLEGALIVATCALAVLVHAWSLPEPAASPGEDSEMPTYAALITISATGLAAALVGAAITRRHRRELHSELDRARGDALERLRMREELESARAIQLAMLPRAAPEPGWLEVAAECRPATEVGGDYYDYFELDADRFLVAIGDVAGHGVAAGIVLSGVRAGLQLLAAEVERPSSTLDRLNRLVRVTGPERLLMSLGLALFDRGTGRVIWASAGNPPALRFAAGDGRTHPLVGAQPPLGTRLPVTYESVEAPLAPGDVWLFVSDGVPESRDPAGEPFGEKAIAESLAAAVTEEVDAAAIRDRILAAAARHRAGREAEDDLTVVVVRRLSP